MGINFKKECDFGQTASGQTVKKYMIRNSKGMCACLTDLGAAVVSLWVIGKEGTNHPVNVALHYGDPVSYERESTYFGATIAPYANRISNARFTLDEKVYELDKNDNENNLHSGISTLAKKCWKVKTHASDNEIVFFYDAKDLEQGFPGNIHYEVAYALTEENELSISYYAKSDRNTLINMTNHTYFNLDGEDAGSVEEQELWIKASSYTPVRDAKAIPTGEVLPVEGTPFDFREPKKIGRDICNKTEQLIFGNGYDHNFVIEKEKNGVEKVAGAYSPKTGIQMEVWTDCIGIQLYTGNFVGGQHNAAGHEYVKHAGFCLETQYYPNSANEEKFPRPYVKANEEYRSKTIYAFCCREGE